MSDRTSMHVLIGRRSLEVPICINAATTHRLAEEINEQLDRIETESDRVNSTEFALRAAFHYASEWRKLQEQQSLDEHELMQALREVLDSLHEILRQAAPHRPGG